MQRLFLTTLFAILATLMVKDAARAESIAPMPCVCNDDCKPYGYGNCSSYGYCDDWGPGIPCQDMGPDGSKKDRGPDAPKLDSGPDVPLPPPMTCSCNADCDGLTDRYCSDQGVCSSEAPGVPCDWLDTSVPPMGDTSVLPMGDSGVTTPGKHGEQAGSEPLDRGCRVGGEDSTLGGLWLLIAALWFRRRRHRVSDARPDGERRS
ncbi:MAG: hypothetical protein CSA65_00235 [Proteobacteria bacterium]|nr:MAG: hypothetical protein CSA65_00235 [Pseudomonadota bacterium]